jgi:hypothetical protein
MDPYCFGPSDPDPYELYRSESSTIFVTLILTKVSALFCNYVNAVRTFINLKKGSGTVLKPIRSETLLEVNFYKLISDRVDTRDI